MKQNFKRNSKSRNMRNTQKKGNRDVSFDRTSTEVEVEYKGKKKFPMEEVKHTYNDVSWYAKNQQMLSDAASYSYNQPLGSHFNMVDFLSPAAEAGDNQVPLNLQPGNSSTSIPSVMSLILAIGPGQSDNYRSPINLAAENIYSYVRYMNSGAKNYDPTDLMLYMFAMDSLYSCWNFYKRAYGIVRSYSQKNWALPRTFVESMGIDFDNLKSRLADFRLYLNTAAARISSFCVPGVMPIFVRHSWLFSNVWKDSDTLKAQSYQFVPLYFYQYNETDSPKGGFLKAVEWSPWVSASTDFANHMKPTLRTVDDMERYLDALIDNLHLSEDIGVMSGDILKAYGQDKLFKLSAVEPDYVVEPVYNEEVLNQIHNSTILLETYHGSFLGNGNFDITQDPDTNILQWDPKFPGELVSKIGAVLNMPWETVTPENTMVGSRLTANWTSSYGGSEGFISHLTSCGTEIVWNAYIAFEDYKTSPSTTRWYGFRNDIAFHAYEDSSLPGWTETTMQSLFKQVQGRMAMLSLLTQFDWHPLCHVSSEYYKTGDTLANHEMQVTYEGCIGDMNNWTIIHWSDLKNMHLTAVMSEFNIPQIGSF